MTDLVYALDLNSDWGSDLTGVIRRHKPGHIVLHSYHGFEAQHHAAIFRDQVVSCKERGVSRGSYLWAFQGYGAEKSAHEAMALFDAAEGALPPVAWVDCETYDDGSYRDPGPDVDWLHACGTALDAIGVRKGLYTSPAFAHVRWGERARELSDWLLWLAHWDGEPALTSAYLPLFGWAECQGKQWAVDLPGDERIDRDVFLPEMTVLPAPVPAFVLPRLALIDLWLGRLGKINAPPFDPANLGICAFWAKQPWEFGGALGPERKADDGSVVQVFEKKAIRWVNGQAEVVG